MQELKNLDDVIEKAGGAPGLATLTRRRTQAVWNWRFRGYIPPQLWRIVTYALGKRGYKVADEVFQFEELDRTAFQRWLARMRRHNSR